MKLNDAADVIQCHPRTVLRKMTKNKHPYWTEDFNPSVSMEDVAAAFECSLNVFKRCVAGHDNFLTPQEAWEEIAKAPRTFKYRKYIPAIRNGGIVRYSRLSLLKQHGDRYPEEFLELFDL